MSFMRDRAPVWTSWPETLTRTPFSVTLTMSLGDFIEVLEDHGAAALLAERAGSRESRSPADTSAPPPVQFPLELKEPQLIALPEIPQEGRGRPSALTSERAQKVIAAACTGASIPACAAAGGVTPNTLKSWLRRKDHEAFLMFQRYFADAETYAALATLKTIIEGVAANPRRAFKKVIG
jgi:hypothetical protein